MMTFFVLSQRSSRSALGRFQVTYSSSLRDWWVSAILILPVVSQEATHRSPTALTISISCAAPLSVSTAAVAVAAPVPALVPAVAALPP